MNFQNLKTSLVIFCNIISFNILIAQNNEQFRVDNILKKYGAETKKINDIEFLIIKTDNTPKPTVLFITGSGFLPFFVNGRMGAFPFNVKEFKDKYNFVIISKPGIPLFVDSISNKHINFTLSEGYYLDTLGQIPKKFTENNNLKYYTKSHNVVINYLSKQSWVENDKLFLIGHSQGAHAATHIALNNK